MADADGPAFSIEGKSAIITGAGSGINLAFASLLLAKGCNVVIADLSLTTEAQKVIEAHSAKTGPRAVFAPTNVVDWGQLARTFDICYAEFGAVDLVCPGAGVFEPAFSNFWYPPGAKGSPSKDPVDGHGHYASLDINLTHPIRMTQLALSWFLNPPRGPKASPQNPKRVICIASIASETGFPAVPLYVASKWGLSGFVRSMDVLEPSYGVRVNAVAPGVVKTPLWAADKIGYIDETQDAWITPEEVAGVMLKLAEDPELVGGTVLEVGLGATRVIPTFGNKGMDGAVGTTLSNAAAAIGEVLGWVNEEGWGRVVA